MNEMYSKHASKYAKVIEDNIFNALYDRPSLMSLIEHETFESCLDLGCGPGAYISELKKNCQHITAIDLSEEFVAIISSKYPDIKAYVADMGRGLEQELDQTFDLVISPLAIHYVENFEKLFSEVNRVLKKGGVFAFSTHHPVVDVRDSISGNYFEREKLTQVWDTLGDVKTEVSYFRRPLSEMTSALFSAGFVIDGLSEGVPSEKIKEISDSHYQKLMSWPQFLFVRCKKLKL